MLKQIDAAPKLTEDHQSPYLCSYFLYSKAMNLSKSDIAKRQIETACEIFLNEGDFLAIVTLAGAAEEILGNLLKRAGKANSMEDIVALDQRLSGGLPFKDVIAEVNAARNALKHARDASEDTVQVRPEDAHAMLSRAISNYVSLTEDISESMLFVFNRIIALHHPSVAG
ncbi:hypothetical protein VB151_04060 [Xanthomonas fragariae]|uniref:hypothetical protein n=2 Tax=Xanthomonas fragariae TaxID=48664 RepID=UPI0011AB3938|nr:hypothetical protein [Xanthomonas fragariae]MBL9197439.1 hypothetical protein [Xanthomonas fragariae]MBL9222575.1 hypothetical protein [Xanthomonas fragariae]MDM7572615.1 hypothetical protein [Xanthomonas fragariae]MDM7581893.1 hypothetical protein [Xanthomonas fragariae]MEA5174153.1 hypothetical protein [Xanthomonas fragariae]